MNSILRRRRAMMGAKSASPILPAEYQQVEYIEADNGTPYISTGISLGTSTPTVKLRYYKASQAVREAALVGCCSGITTKLEIGFTATTNRLFAFSSSSAQIISNIIYGNVVDVVVQLNNTSPYITMTASSGGTTETNSKTGENATNLANATINLFAVGNGNFDVYARMYWCEFLDRDNQIANFIPCYRKADSVIGMYDTVSNTFYTNSGTGTFTKGANV